MFVHENHSFVDVENVGRMQVQNNQIKYERKYIGIRYRFVFTF